MAAQEEDRVPEDEAEESETTEEPQEDSEDPQDTVDKDVAQVQHNQATPALEEPAGAHPIDGDEDNQGSKPPSDR